MPSGCIILCVQVQDNIPCIWYINPCVDHNNSVVTRVFRIITTGEERHGIPSKYIGTFQLKHGRFVGHLFELNNLS